MIGVLTGQLYKPVGIPSHFPPIQGLLLHSPEHPPLRFIHLTHQSTSMDAITNAKSLRKEKLMALPSVSCSLSALPQARSLEQVSLHPSSMSAQHAAESEAKVRFVLTDPPRSIGVYPRHSSAKSSQSRAPRLTHH